MFKARLQKLRERLNSEGLDALLIESDNNRFYMSGFHGSNGLLYISDDKGVLFTDFRYIEQAIEQAVEFEIIRAGQDGLLATCVEHFGDDLCRNIGIEKAEITLAVFDRMKEVFPDSIEFIPVEKLVEDLRQVKYPEEIELIKKAQSIAEQAFNELLGKLRPDMTEKEAAFELDTLMRRYGSGPQGFDTIVGAGPNAALPHHFPDDTQLGDGRTIVIDFGASFGWYNSDTTRTVFIGSAPDECVEIYNIVLEAQLMAIDALDNGKTGVEIDRIARDFISNRGFADYFGHGLGHGIGVAVHEGPTLSMKSEDILEAFNIFSVEPGIYIPDMGGVRIEDLCWLKPEGGFEDITNLPKELVIL